MNNTNKRIIGLSFFIIFIFSYNSYAGDGYKLWLDYKKVGNETLLNHYKDQIQSISIFGDSKTITVAQEELLLGLNTLLDYNFTINPQANFESSLIISSINNLNNKLKELLKNDVVSLKKDGFIIKAIGNQIFIVANEDVGLLYGVFRFVKEIQTQQSIDKINIVDSPKIDVRMLNHWDNLDRTVERGYSGYSIWNWHTLPEYIDQTYIDYARANASIGINGTALTSVNANALVLNSHYLQKVKALADVFRPYGIKVYLTARFSAPMEIGGLKTADPLDADVIKWWSDKANEIYALIPDFGGFLVKANSEGQPGPNEYGRNHKDGANMMADALAPHGGIVMWRAFVYSEHDASDRAKQAYSEFVPYDGQFRDNVIIQVKNGAIDFQPREPFHPMFGAMPKTNLMMEFQITQEYMGCSTHLVYQPKLYEEVFKADTYRKGKGSTVAKVVDGSLHNKKITGVAGVSNIGSDRNWTGHHFLQSNWYGFGRLAWDPYLDSEDIAEDWVRMTFTNVETFVTPITDILVKSRETVVNYMTPLGLHHIMATNHHYGPGPWVSDLGRPEWNPVYYHKADEEGVGFNRTQTGSNATGQYAPEVAEMYNNTATTPEIDLLWFHHLPWDYKLKNGQSLWNGMALKYQQGVDEVKYMVTTWNNLESYVDTQRFNEVKMMLDIQYKEAKWWRDACLLYFQQFSKMELPKTVEKPTQTLEYFKSLQFPYAPGIQPRW